MVKTVRVSRGSPGSSSASLTSVALLCPQCSTLMLLDSAKDPLVFSVIHFKHPKQPHTVQVTAQRPAGWPSPYRSALVCGLHRCCVCAF